MSRVFKVFLGVLIASSTAFGHTCLKLFVLKETFSDGYINIVMKIVTSVYLWAALFLYALSFYLSMRLYKIAKLTIVTPFIMGAIFIFVVLFSVWFLGEDINFIKIIGMAIILSGIFLVMKS